MELLLLEILSCKENYKDFEGKLLIGCFRKKVQLEKKEVQFKHELSTKSKKRF